MLLLLVPLQLQVPVAMFLLLEQVLVQVQVVLILQKSQEHLLIHQSHHIHPHNHHLSKNCDIRKLKLPLKQELKHHTELDLSLHPLQLEQQPLE